ncbi:MAG: hypothetical protein KR126chlam1_00112 [Chlamydiae bacterium]|nr:hypothetical protein [Chlamydiota bacterium]
MAAIGQPSSNTYFKSTFWSGTYAVIGRLFVPYGDVPKSEIKKVSLATKDAFFKALRAFPSQAVAEIKKGPNHIVNTVLGTLSNIDHTMVKTTLRKYSYSFALGASIGLTTALIKTQVKKIPYLRSSDIICTGLSLYAGVVLVSVLGESISFIPATREEVFNTALHILAPELFFRVWGAIGQILGKAPNTLRNN